MGPRRAASNSGHSFHRRTPRHGPSRTSTRRPGPRGIMAISCGATSNNFPARLKSANGLLAGDQHLGCRRKRKYASIMDSARDTHARHCQPVCGHRLRSFIVWHAVNHVTEGVSTYAAAVSQRYWQAGHPSSTIFGRGFTSAEQVRFLFVARARNVLTEGECGSTTYRFVFDAWRGLKKPCRSACSRT